MSASAQRLDSNAGSALTSPFLTAAHRAVELAVADWQETMDGLGDSLPLAPWLVRLEVFRAAQRLQTRIDAAFAGTAEAAWPGVSVAGPEARRGAR